MCLPSFIIFFTIFSCLLFKVTVFRSSSSNFHILPCQSSKILKFQKKWNFQNLCKFSFFFKNSHFLKNFQKKRELKNLRNKKQNFQKKIRFQNFQKLKRYFQTDEKNYFCWKFYISSEYSWNDQKNTETIFGKWKICKNSEKYKNWNCLFFLKIFVFVFINFQFFENFQKKFKFSENFKISKKYWFSENSLFLKIIDPQVFSKMIKNNHEFSELGIFPKINKFWNSKMSFWVIWVLGVWWIFRGFYFVFGVFRGFVGF